MTSSYLVKILAAFVSGLVVALGSALIYVRVAEQRHVTPVPAAPVSTATTPKDVPDAAAANVTEQESAPASEGAQVEQAPVQHPTKRAQSQSHNVSKSTQPKSPPKPLQLARAQTLPAPKVHVPPIDEVTPPVPVQPSSDKAIDPAPDLKNSSNTPEVTEAAAPAPPAVAAPPQPHIVTLPAGTAVSIRMGETVSTEHNYTGDTFRATLLTPIIQKGFIIADRGSKVLGRVVDAQPAGHMSATAGLTLALTEINTTDGQRVSIETSTYQRRSTNNIGPDTAKIAGGAALGAIIGGIAGGGKGAAIGAGAGGAAGTGAVLLTRGKPATVETETPLTFRLANPVTITEKLN
jgi:hypothetical protein